LYTGKNSGNIGVFDFIKPDGSLVTFNDFRKHKVIWQWLGDYGYSSILFGTRLTEPVYPLEGFLIPDDNFNTKTGYQTYPEDLKNILESSDFFLDYGFLEQQKRKKDCHGIYRLLLKNMRDRFRLFSNLITTKKFDFALVWVGHTDVLQHQCWDNKELIKKFFTEVDSLIGDLVKEHKFKNVFVISDHGFGAAAEYNFHLNEWLYKEGYLKMKWGLVGRYVYVAGYRIAESIIPDSVKKKILNILRNVVGNQNRNKSFSKDLVITPLDNIPGVDWSKTIAHVTTDKCWGIRIIKENLNRDYEEVREEIIQKLKQLEFKGKRVIKDAWRGEEIYWGEYQDQIPDIIFLKEDIFRVRPSLVRKMFTKIRRKYGNYVGDHGSARDGIFIAYGEDIKDTGEYIGEVQIYDLAPTILHMYGIPIPGDMDGRVLKEMFKEGSDPYIRKIEYQEVDKEKELISSKIRELRKLGKI
jgi:predicted AlkP superfamily phosphohydrolase/phosphomutase